VTTHRPEGHGGATILSITSKTGWVAGDAAVQETRARGRPDPSHPSGVCRKGGCVGSLVKLGIAIVTVVDTPNLETPSFREEPLYSVSSEITVFDSTRDGRLVFWFETSAEGRAVPIVNGTAGPTFDGFWDPLERLGRDPLRGMLVESAYTFSEDGCHFAYVGRRGPAFFVVKDGVQSSKYERMETGPSFGPTGSTLVYVARVDGKTRLVLDGEVQLGFEVATPWQGLRFSPDGSHLAMRARVQGGEAMVLDGTVGPTFRRVWPDPPICQVTENGRLSYMAMRRKRLRRRYLLIIDGNVVAESGSLFWGGRMSPDGSRFLYAEYESHRWFVEGDPLPEGTKQAEFAPDGRLYTDVDGQAFLDGVPLGVAAWLGYPAFTRDGRHSAWSAKVGHKQVLVRDGVHSSEEMESVGYPVFSPDGSRVAFVARLGEQECVIVDDSKGPLFDRVHSLHFSPDGHHLAYWAKRTGRSFLVSDQSPGPPVDGYREPAAMWHDPGVLEFSPDGQHVAAVAILGAKMRPLVDGNLGPELEKSGQPVFDNNHAVSFFGLRGQSIVRVRATLG
jgi:WD40-like Beta Propeller Repeat